MGENDLDYGYEPFADTPEYRAVNETIVQRWVNAMREAGSVHLDRIVDLATGVGTMVQLLIEKLPRAAKPKDVVCVDMSDRALEQAGANLAGSVDRVTPIHSPVQDLALEPESVDMAMWGNGVHYLTGEEQRRTFERIREALRPGGWFLFNSAFVAESRPAETLAFYRGQIATAVRSLRERGVKREKSTPAAESAMFLPLSHYRQMLEQTGFRVEEVREVVAQLYQSAWEKISGFSQYAAGALHGYPLDDAAEALVAAVKPALEQYGFVDEHGERYVPRHWYFAIARKELGALRSGE